MLYGTYAIIQSMHMLIVQRMQTYVLLYKHLNPAPSLDL